jgi:hypothetical protein
MKHCAAFVAGAARLAWAEASIRSGSGDRRLTVPVPRSLGHLLALCAPWRVGDSTDGGRGRSYRRMDNLCDGNQPMPSRTMTAGCYGTFAPSRNPAA